MDTRNRLNDYLARLADGGLCIAFSGGVDSAVLLKAACEVCNNVHAMTVNTLLHPSREPEQAEKLALESGARFKLLKLDLPEQVLDNPPERCYFCKNALFTALCGYAREYGLKSVLDGTNADDLNEYRPGLRALSELHVKSPLAELGITKPQVREIARAMGISVAEKPSSPCLATRIPYNTRIDAETLRRIDGLEAHLKSLGFLTVRARVHGDTVRIEMPPEQFSQFLLLREEIVNEAKRHGFLRVTLDLEGFRSGSFDHFATKSQG